MRRFGIALVTAAFALVAACDGGLPVCTDLFAFGLNVTVVDGAGSLVCDATVTATDGDYEETLEASPGGACAYIGAGERPGTYRVEAKKTGFVTAAEDGVNVVLDEEGCHVVGASVTLTLLPQ